MRDFFYINKYVFSGVEDNMPVSPCERSSALVIAFEGLH